MSKLFYVALIMLVLCAVAFAETAKPKKIGRQYEDEERYGEKKKGYGDDRDRKGDDRKGDDRKGDDRKGDDRKGDDRKGHGEDRKGDDRKGDDRKGDDRKGYGEDRDRDGDRHDEDRGYGDDRHDEDRDGDRHDEDRYGDDRRDGDRHDEDRGYGEDRHEEDRDGDRFRDGDRDRGYGDDRREGDRYGEERGYGQERKGYGEQHHHKAPAIKSAKVFKVCNYVNSNGVTGSTCAGEEGSCLLVENAKCYTTIYGTSLQINLVGDTATVLYFPASTTCVSSTVPASATVIMNNVNLDTCVADPDATGAAAGVSWKISRIRF